MTEKNFQKCARRAGASATGRNEVQCHLGIVLLLFWKIHYVNDGRFLTGNKVLETEQVQKA